MSGSNRISRRHFLFAAGASGAAAATVLLATRKDGATALPENAKTPPAQALVQCPDHGEA